jgi:hypothetical protein
MVCSALPPDMLSLLGTEVDTCNDTGIGLPPFLLDFDDVVSCDEALGVDIGAVLGVSSFSGGEETSRTLFELDRPLNLGRGVEFGPRGGVALTSTPGVVWTAILCLVNGRSCCLEFSFVWIRVAAL